MLLSVCGSDDNVTVTQEIPAPATVPNVLVATIYTGVLLDSVAVAAGLNYKTASQSGKTNEFGEFNFKNDETIIFSIGGIDPPNTVASLNLGRYTNNSIEISESIHQLVA